ncbi:DUF2169 domain-containing protein [Limnobaculum zhutongyuii]|uniref:DUF2169 domain-containing protein n=1 Tax=Limnobaculum zhutongyuii TaxID=2498113 RepID=A0A411WLA5_9GAMM|nr:DUF2169 domain-containing protein [Limnobaculum zhutongyuii]QBH97021.1 DUF2169 domain-containing protein [Limnobaculum zhutongyuii]TQS87429.1 DUF2169 domain-containing protein [Limnobaculum zhutongyuii]
MQFINKTKFEACWIPGLGTDGREQLVVIIKVTYQMPQQEGEINLANVQRNIIEADISTGEPGFSAILYESDYVSYKPMCDVLFNGCAYAPFEEEVKELVVSLQVGKMYKSFKVIGDRTWGESHPQPFTMMPISYDNAFGGTDISDKKKFRFYRDNPIGTGYSYHCKNIVDMSLPNTEELNSRVKNPKGSYKPMAFGVIGRAWQPRIEYAGTYNNEWIENTMPFYPEDFDIRYFQSAPPEQQVPYIKGGERVILKNLSANGIESFLLPKQDIPVIFTQYKGGDILLHSVVDTLVIEPELGIFSMVSRATLPLRKNLHDIKKIIVGDVEREWRHKQRVPDKKYYATLADFIVQKRR